MSKESKGSREARIEINDEPRAEPRVQGENSVFEGSTHVLRGLEQQLTYWETLEGHEGAKAEMVGVLRVASRALREALKRAKAADR
ncbi:MAG TPA: hypothetical protein VGM59_07630 [Dongiaceae bacterium]|jgi:hypothetical protein